MLCCADAIPRGDQIVVRKFLSDMFCVVVLLQFQHVGSLFRTFFVVAMFNVVLFLSAIHDIFFRRMVLTSVDRSPDGLRWHVVIASSCLIAFRCIIVHFDC